MRPRDPAARSQHDQRHRGIAEADAQRGEGQDTASRPRSGTCGSRSVDVPMRPTVTMQQRHADEPRRPELRDPAGLEPRSDRPGQRGDRDDDARDLGGLAAPALEGERHERVRAEERERQRAAQQDRRRQAAREPERARRRQRPEREQPGDQAHDRDRDPRAAAFDAVSPASSSPVPSGEQQARSGTRRAGALRLPRARVAPRLRPAAARASAAGSVSAPDEHDDRQQADEDDAPVELRRDRGRDRRAR